MGIFRVSFLGDIVASHGAMSIPLPAGVPYRYTCTYQERMRRILVLRISLSRHLLSFPPNFVRGTYGRRIAHDRDSSAARPCGTHEAGGASRRAPGSLTESRAARAGVWTSSCPGGRGPAKKVADNAFRVCRPHGPAGALREWRARKGVRNSWGTAQNTRYATRMKVCGQCDAVGNIPVRCIVVLPMFC